MTANEFIQYLEGAAAWASEKVEFYKDGRPEELFYWNGVLSAYNEVRRTLIHEDNSAPLDQEVN